MKLSSVQFSPCLGDLKGTISALDAHLAQAAGSDLVVLPELCNSGYNFDSLQQAMETAETTDGEFIEYLTIACRIHGFHVVSGFNERDGDKLYNSAVLIGPRGVVGKYRKLHLFMNEKDFFQPGDLGIPTFVIEGVRIGMLVCFDWAFPEIWRILGLQDCDVVCHPSNLVLPGFAQRAIPAYALTNRYFVVTANRIGTERDLTFTGMSVVADPHGNILSQSPTDAADVACVDVNLDAARQNQITPRNHLLNDRRPEIYRPYFEN